MEIQNRKQKDGISKFLDINTDSKCKWTEFTKHTMTECIKKKIKTQPNAAYKKLTSTLRTYTQAQREGIEKIYFVSGK